MDNESIKNNDPFQLQQMIIFLKAELAKYKNEVRIHRESDYYSLVVKLEEEIVQLMSEKKELSLVILKLKKDFEKEKNEYNEVIQSQDIQRVKQISSIEALLKEKNELRTINKQLSEALKKAQEELVAYSQDRGELREVNYKGIIDNLENKLIDFFQETNKQMHSVVGKFEETHKEMHESDYVKKYLVKELEEKSNEIEKLLHKITELKERDEDATGGSSSLDGEQAKNNQVLAYLDAQVEKVMGQSRDFEEQLDEKLRILNDLERKLDQLVIDIEGQ
ncbi:hypothetical protein ACIQ2D_11815 [Lysinibacillus sp. NPDC097287]|uniref:hypothetical protein n=1 Tax=Lysinibacillus sp. NPDC097287 TaxID=3364144 RepID=UPI00380BE636